MKEVQLREPFKGLQAFEEVDAPIFFGRDQERALVSANLRTRRLTILYGPSGVGKSSLIHAGVVHHLNTIRRRSPRVLVVFSNWSGNPLQELKTLILSAFQQEFPDLINAETMEEPSSASLAELLVKLIKDTNAELLIILDQFEEYFVYHGLNPGSEPFDQEFVRAVVESTVPANFLISIREDWLARLDRFQQDIPNIFENTIRIEHLTRSAAEEAISQPIKKYNETIEEVIEGSTFSITVEPGFIKRVLDQLESLERDSSIGADEQLHKTKKVPPYIQASRLQIVMSALWGRIKHSTVPTFSLSLVARDDEAKQIFESNLKNVLRRLSRRQKIVASKFVALLVSDLGTKFASTAEWLAARSRQPTAKVRAVLDRLSERDIRLLNKVLPSPIHPESPRYELTSDVLADPLLGWSRDMAYRQRLRTVFALFVVCLIVGIVVLKVVQDRIVAENLLRIVQQEQRKTEEEKNRAERALDVVRTQNNKAPHLKTVLRRHAGRVTAAVFTPDGEVLTTSQDGSAIIWDIETGKPVRDFYRDEKGLTCAAVSPFGDSIATASTDGSVRLWDFKTGRSVQLRKPLGQHMTAISFSPGGDFIVAANTVGTIVVWVTSTGDQIKELPGNNSAVRQISFSPSGQLLAVASDDHSVHLWKSSDWSYFRKLVGHTERVNGLAFSPGEDSIATVSADTTLRLWQLSDGQSRTFSGHTASVNSVDFDRDGGRLLTCSDDTTSRIWNVQTGKSTQLIGHTDKVLSSSFSPDGSQVVTASKDATVRLWSASTGMVLAELLGHEDEVTYVTYSSDGRFILTASDDATARVWNASIGVEFRLEQPVIEAKPADYFGPCPVTLSFPVSLRASNAGTVIYRYSDSAGRIWEYQTLTFEKAGLKYVNWYWRITSDFQGWQSIEIIEPKGIRPQKVKFSVDCTNDSSAAPGPSASPTIAP
jgi:WD40 repeat protein